jgi:hypothetical protein
MRDWVCITISVVADIVSKRNNVRSFIGLVTVRGRGGNEAYQLGCWANLSKLVNT